MYCPQRPGADRSLPHARIMRFPGTDPRMQSRHYVLCTTSQHLGQSQDVQRPQLRMFSPLLRTLGPVQLTAELQWRHQDWRLEALDTSRRQHGFCTCLCCPPMLRRVYIQALTAWEGATGRPLLELDRGERRSVRQMEPGPRTHSWARRLRSLCRKRGRTSAFGEAIACAWAQGGPSEVPQQERCPAAAASGGKLVCIGRADWDWRRQRLGLPRHLSEGKLALGGNCFVRLKERNRQRRLGLRHFALLHWLVDF